MKFGATTLAVGGFLLDTSAAADCNIACGTSGCNSRQIVQAMPCDGTSTPASFREVPAGNGTVQIKLRDDDSLCLTWSQQGNDLILENCAGANGLVWTDDMTYDCQHFVRDSNSNIAVKNSCRDNEWNLNGCLDIHGKVGPTVQLTKCYDQANDHFLLDNETGVISNEEDLPNFPKRCFVVEDTFCTMNACCRDCGEGYEMSDDGLCNKKVQKKKEKKVNIFLATTNNYAGVEAAAAELSKHRNAFTGVIFQYDGICGAGSMDCAEEDSVGDAHFATAHPASPAHNITAILRGQLGDDLELYPIISYGDTNRTELVDSLFQDDDLAKKFTIDALKQVQTNSWQGINWDIEPTCGETCPYLANTKHFLEQFASEFHEADPNLIVSWDSNGFEGDSYGVDQWIAMSTYYGGQGWIGQARRGMYAVGDAFVMGYCPTCQKPASEEEVKDHFTWLNEGAGLRVNEIDVWAFYGREEEPSGDDETWGMYFKYLEEWLID